MKSFFENDTCNEILSRLDQLTNESQPTWGKMNVGQMLHHCQMPLNVILQKETYGLKPNWIVKLLFKKSMFSDKPWPKNSPTAPGFRITEQKEFETEKQELIQLINELHAQREKENWQPHPVFGKLSKTEWGKMQYKHLDHHLSQFGV